MRGQGAPERGRLNGPEWAEEGVGGQRGGLHHADSSSGNTANTDVCQHISLPTLLLRQNLFGTQNTNREKNVAAGMKNT